MNKERIADAATASAWSFLGISMTQLTELLQLIAVLLAIASTGISIYIHIRSRFWR